MNGIKGKVLYTKCTMAHNQYKKYTICKILYTIILKMRHNKNTDRQCF